MKKIMKLESRNRKIKHWKGLEKMKHIGRIGQWIEKEQNQTNE